MSEGRISWVGPAGTHAEVPDEDIYDLGGYTLIPSLVEPHAHLDKAFTMAATANPAGTLVGAVTAWLALRQTLSVSDILSRARRAALRYLARGCTAIRTHVDVGTGIELRALEALSKLRSELAGTLELQLVALPSVPLTGKAGAGNREHLRAALESGVDLVGGAPQRDPDPGEYLRICFELAEEHSLPVDMHIDETLDTSSIWVEQLPRIVSEGFPHRVTASHCVSLGMQPLQLQVETARRLAEAEISVISCPITNLHLHGRESETSPPRGLTALRALAEAGVMVAAGGDNVQDAFNPLGSCDPLVTAGFLIAAGHLTPEVACKLVTDHARAAMGLPPATVSVGSPADVVAARGLSVAEVVASMPSERFVWARGRLVAQTHVEQRFPDAEWLEQVWDPPS